MRSRNQWLALLCAAGVWLALVFVEAQAPAGPAPRTPWGTPDLQGIWSNPVVVPFERAKEYDTREYLTDEELAKAEQALLERNKRPGRDSREFAGRPALGTEKDVARAYNEHWFGD